MGAPQEAQQQAAPASDLQVPWGPWAPDAGPTQAGICLIADGVLPKQQGYRPMAGLSVPTAATALPAAPRGILSVVKNDGTWQVYACTSDSLYVMTAAFGWTLISAGFNCTAGDDWCMQHFGSKLLFTNTTDGLQQYDIEAGGAVSAITAAGHPRWIFISNDQVVALDCLSGFDASGSRDNRLVRVSAFGDQTNWTTAGADYQSIEVGGPLVCGGDIKSSFALLLQERGAQMMRFGDFGDGKYFSLEVMSNEVGCVGAKSAVFVDGAAYWWATDGCCKFSPSYGMQYKPDMGMERPGAGMTDLWFLGLVDQANFTLMQGAADPLNRIVWWRWKRLANVSTTVFEDLIGYDWQWGKWVSASVQTTALARIATPGYTMEDLDALYGTLDAMTVPLDSRTLQGGQPVFAAVNGSLKFGTFSGQALGATLQSSITNSPVTGLIGWCTPIDDASDGTVQLGVADVLSDAITWKTAASRGRAGRVPLRGRGMNISFQRNIPAGSMWSDARGINHITSHTGGPK